MIIPIHCMTCHAWSSYNTGNSSVQCHAMACHVLLFPSHLLVVESCVLTGDTGGTTSARAILARPNKGDDELLPLHWGGGAMITNHWNSRLNLLVPEPNSNSATTLLVPEPNSNCTATLLVPGPSPTVPLL